MYTYLARVARVIDGDTVDLDIELGFHMTARVRVRYLAVDTPERGHRDFTAATMENAALLAAAADDEGRITVRTERTGKYGRWLAIIPGVTDVLSRKYPYPSR